MDQLRQVFRRLGRAPLFTTITLITLGLGVGATALIFSVVEGVLLKPLPYPHSEQLISVAHTAPGIGIKELNMAPSIYFIDREQSTTLQDIGAYDGDSLTVTGIGEPEHVAGLDVTDGTLRILGVVPALGRIFTREDDSPGSPATVLLSYEYWRRRFDGAPSVIGRSITVDGKSRQIIGVLPQGFQFLDDQDDLALFSAVPVGSRQDKARQLQLGALARLKPGVTMEQASADMARLLPVAMRSFPPPDGFSIKLFESAQIAPNLRPLKQKLSATSATFVGLDGFHRDGAVDRLRQRSEPVASARGRASSGVGHSRSVRRGMAANRGRICCSRASYLGVLGSLLGLAFAYAGVARSGRHGANAELPRLHEIGIDVPVLLFTLGDGALSSVLIGSIPVLQVCRSAFEQPACARADARLEPEPRATSRAKYPGDVAGRAGAGAADLLGTDDSHISRADACAPGFAGPDTVQTFRFYVPETQMPDTERERLVRMEQRMLDKIAAIPGVSRLASRARFRWTGTSSNDPILVAQDRLTKEGEIPPVRRFKMHFSRILRHAWALRWSPGAISRGQTPTRRFPLPSFPKILRESIGMMRETRSANGFAWAARTTGAKLSASSRTCMTTASTSPRLPPCIGPS